MGVAGVWEGETQHRCKLLEFAIDFHSKYNRWPVIAMDMFPVMYELLDGSKSIGYRNYHLQFIRRMRGFLACGIIPIGVFDGKDKLDKRRNALNRKGVNIEVGVYKKVLDYMKKAMIDMGLTVVNAMSEGEAQCVEIQNLGFADYVFSSDSDVFSFGGQKLMRFAADKEQTSGPLRNRQVICVDTLRYSKGRWAYMLRAFLQGNDYSPGIKGIGSTRAAGLASIESLVDKFQNWYFTSDFTELLEELHEELHTNKSKAISKRWGKDTAIHKSCFNEEVIRVWAHPKINKITLPKAETGKCWKPMNPAALKRLWEGKSPIIGKASPPENAPKLQEPRKIKDTIEVIITQIWCLRKIMVGEFTDEFFIERLRKAAKTTQIETVQLRVDNIKRYLHFAVPSTVELPVHLMANSHVIERNPQNPPKSRAVARNNQTINFQKGEDRAAMVAKAQRSLSSSVESMVPEKGKIQPDQPLIIDLGSDTDCDEQEQSKPLQVDKPKGLITPPKCAETKSRRKGNFAAGNRTILDFWKTPSKAPSIDANMGVKRPLDLAGKEANTPKRRF